MEVVENAMVQRGQPPRHLYRVEAAGRTWAAAVVEQQSRTRARTRTRSSFSQIATAQSMQ